jgi:exodeoxyribonuclease VII large subunit
LKFKPTHGTEVLALGYVSVYERDGQYQFYVQEMLPEGRGSLHFAYEQLKTKLTQAGIFAKAKRPIPFFPKKIGIVTSPTGAALRDILSILKRRNQQAEVLIVPALVQGKEGVSSIVNSLDALYSRDVDVIIIGRGGGSLEELWCFNEEEVVVKVSQSPVPIISAVGHETDVTLTDFASDFRAATPSMAAEVVSPVKDDLLMQIKQLEARLYYLMKQVISNEKQRVEYLAQSSVLKDPYRLLTNKQLEIDKLSTKLANLGRGIVDQEKHQLALLAGILDTLSPMKTLERGYSITFKDNNQVIKNIKDVTPGEKINILLTNGRIRCLVEGTEEGVRWKQN